MKHQAQLLKTRLLPTATKKTASVPFNIKCLLDLPPVAPNSVRVYLCRHGQTEFNRLKKVQGARIDQPLNETGEKMSFRIGQALAELPPEQRPSKILHSPLRRAKETAFGAVDTIMKSTAADKPLTLQLLPELGEIDFGKSEGTDATKAKVNMLNTFTSWSRGNIDYSYEGGESGRQVRMCSWFLEELYDNDNLIFRCRYLTPALPCFHPFNDFVAAS